MIGRTAWGALTGSGPAVRGGCRAFEFVSLAGVHSAPNTPSPGIALEIGSCGAGLFRRELVSPCWALPRGPARGGQRVRAGRRTHFVGGPLSVARENLSLTNPLQPGSDRLREGSDVQPCVCALHGNNHGESREQAVAKNLQGIARVRS